MSSIKFDPLADVFEGALKQPASSRKGFQARIRARGYLSLFWSDIWLAGLVVGSCLALQKLNDEVSPAKGLSIFLPEGTLAEIENITKTAFDLPKPLYKILQKPIVDFLAGPTCLFGGC
ncbi:hypothetical protein PG997_010888 [Apiospora hydei]|uniref:Uncharacterized protein n=1 Tax=Apiospora hydei TaxID=1337664 RepID=A0ABR1VKC6_9PEZI